MRVLVTGGAGYIGSHFAQQAKRAGHQVLIYDNLTTGFHEAVKGFDLVIGDLRDQELLFKTFKDYKPEAVVHFAAKLVVPESVQFPELYHDNNVNGSLKLLEAIKAHQTPFMVFSSTAAVYGNVQSGLVGEDAAPQPANPYGASKLQTERNIQEFAKANPWFRYQILRYFNVCGASLDGSNGQRTKNATLLVKVVAEVAAGRRPFVEIFGTDYSTEDGSGVRDYIHVDDLVSVHLLALDKLKGGEPSNLWNCGYGVGYSVRQVIETMKKVTGKAIEVRESPRRPGDVAKVIARIDKIKNQWGWPQSKKTLEEICYSTYLWETRREK